MDPTEGDEKREPAPPPIERRATMQAAVEEMRLSKSAGGKPTPLVGAAALLPDGSVVRAHRSEYRNGDHAEYTLFERKLPSQALDGVDLFVTLEPCAPGARSPHKTACSQRIVDARIKDVWIGCPDPYPTVAGKGRAFLEENGVTVHDFDADLRDVILRENAGLLRARWGGNASRNRGGRSRRRRETTPR